jgi:DeoR family transcriptional regulator, fructose operon transcriptional repressor
MTTTDDTKGDGGAVSGGSKLQHHRQREIYVLALRSGSVDVSDLARRFDVTTETIRRDLSDLQERKLLRRVHGGAVPFERLHHEPMIDARDMLNPEEKLRIGREAIHDVPEQGSVIIDSGSTGQRLAEVFPVDRDVHVVTNSLLTASTLIRRGVRELTVLGGGVRTNTFAMVDAATVEAVRALRVDVLFISCDGLSFQRGLTTPYHEESVLKRAMIESARRAVAIVDQSKFGNDQMFTYAALDEIDVLVTDTGADDDSLTVLAEHDLEVRRA